MKIDVKWKKKNNGEITSPDNLEEVYQTQNEALDAGVL